MNFVKQINQNIKNASHKLYMFSRLRDCMDNHIALNLFKTMVLPYIELGNSLLLCRTEMQKIRLQRLKSKGAQIGI